MKRYLTIYDNNKTYLYPNMKAATPETVRIEYDSVNVEGLKCVIETDVTGLLFYTVPEPMHLMAERLGVDISNLHTDEEIIIAIEEAMNTPQQESSQEPSAEERIAAALEYQNLLSM